MGPATPAYDRLRALNIPVDAFVREAELLVVRCPVCTQTLTESKGCPTSVPVIPAVNPATKEFRTATEDWLAASVVALLEDVVWVFVLWRKENVGRRFDLPSISWLSLDPNTIAEVCWSVIGGTYD